MANEKPLRMSLTQLSTARTVEALSNPPELEEVLKVNWEQPDVIGLPYKPQQYSNTDNHTLNFTLQFDAYQDGKNQLAEMLYFRRFLLSLCYPRRGSADIIGGSPTRFLFLWPNFIALACTMQAMTIRHSRFDRDGNPTVSAAELSIQNISDVRFTSEDVINSGTLRANAT